MKKSIFKKFVSLTAAASMMMSMAVMANAAEYTDATELKVGDYVQMGTYNSQTILWRVVGGDSNAPLLMTDEALAGAKEFDNAGDIETGSHSRNNPTPTTDKDGKLETRKVKGSDYWADSNIRDWLNSDSIQPAYTCGNNPSYVDEPGFLNGFSEAEKNLIKEVPQTTLVSVLDSELDGVEGTASHQWKSNIGEVISNYSDAFKMTTIDKVFIPDVKQIKEVYDGGSDLGTDYYQSKLNGNKVFSWLRTPVGGQNGNDVRLVSTDGTIGSSRAVTNKSGLGIGVVDVYVRPMMYLDAANAVLASGMGSVDAPYTLEVKAPDFTAAAENVGAYTGETEGDIATGFLATVTNNGTGAGSFSSMDITVKPSEGNGVEKTFENKSTTATLAAGAKAYFGIIVENLKDKDATADVTVK